MIKALHIEHYALIDQLDINFHSGFSVITGETGAGKSIILGAIGLLLGERADTKSIKSGENRCVIEAEFDLSNYEMGGFFDDNDLDFDGKECIIRRELTSTGKSRAFINDTPVGVAALKDIGGQLIDIHSQHQNLLLGKENFQLNILDILAKNSDETECFKGKFQHYKEVCHQLETALSMAQQGKDDEDYLRFQVNQLEEANLQADEQEELEAEQEILSHAEEIKQNLYVALNGLTNDSESDTIQNLQQSISALRNITGVFPQSEELIGRLESCRIELQDIASELESAADNVEYDPQRLELVEDRLNTIYSLQKKHHVDTIGQLLELQAQMEEKLSLIDNSEEHIEELKKAQKETFEALKVQGAILTARRTEAKLLLEQNMKELLIPLGMPNVQFEVEIQEKPEPDISGFDKVAFLFSANKNIPPQNLSQIASGGEIARVMLSLKALIAGAVKLPTIIFDEIDTGVSGSIAEKMALIMKDMGNHNRQVISITHLPQIAAMGSSHYKVYKEEGIFSTTTHIVELNRQQRIEEVAHMLSGSAITEAAINNAKELLKL